MNSQETWNQPSFAIRLATGLWKPWMCHHDAAAFCLGHSVLLMFPVIGGYNLLSWVKGLGTFWVPPGGRHISPVHGLRRSYWDSLPVHSSGQGEEAISRVPEQQPVGHRWRGHPGAGGDGDHCHPLLEALPYGQAGLSARHCGQHSAAAEGKGRDHLSNLWGRDGCRP